MRGVNQKAADAKQRKKAAATAKKEEQTRLREDAKWVDDDKHVNAKIERKAELEAKQEDKLRRKQELRELEKQEAHSLKSYKTVKQAPRKLTRAEVMLRQLQSEKEKEREATSEVAPNLLQPNINHLLREENYNMLLEGKQMIEATSILDALKQLDQNGAIDTDRHLEKRVRAAHKAYEKEWMDRLRQECPELKRSQLRERIFRQWQRAAENPLNQKQSQS